MAGTTSVSGYSIDSVVRALIFVQAVVVSKSRITDEINSDIKTGKIAIHLLNPINYVWFKFLEFFPKFVYNFCISCGVGLVLGFLFLGGISTSLPGIAGAIILVLGGMLIAFFGYMMIGLLGFYTEDNEAFRLIYGKIDMFFGGNILPIPFMPLILQTIALSLPFFHSGYTAGLIFSHFTMDKFLLYLGIQIIRVVVFISACLLIFSHAIKRLTIN